MVEIVRKCSWGHCRMHFANQGFLKVGRIMMRSQLDAMHQGQVFVIWLWLLSITELFRGVDGIRETERLWNFPARDQCDMSVSCICVLQMGACAMECCNNPNSQSSNACDCFIQCGPVTVFDFRMWRPAQSLISDTISRNLTSENGLVNVGNVPILERAWTVWTLCVSDLLFFSVCDVAIALWEHPFLTYR